MKLRCSKEVARPGELRVPSQHERSWWDSLIHYLRRPAVSGQEIRGFFGFLLQQAALLYWALAVSPERTAREASSFRVPRVQYSEPVPRF
jgi:hypothetical protein